MAKIIVAFRKFVKAPTKCSLCVEKRIWSRSGEPALLLKQFIFQKKKASGRPIKKEGDLHLRPYFFPSCPFCAVRNEGKNFVSNVNKAPDSDWRMGSTFFSPSDKYIIIIIIIIISLALSLHVLAVFSLCSNPIHLLPPPNPPPPPHLHLT